MKKLIPIILTILCVISVVGNICLFQGTKSMKKTLTSEQASLNTTLVEKESAISEANKKGAELDASVTDLQAQLNELQTKLDNTKVVAGFSVESIEPLTMYVISEEGAPARKGASDDYITDETLLYGQEVTVTGKTSNGWYQVDWGDGKAYVADGLLSDTDPYAGTEYSESNNQTKELTEEQKKALEAGGWNGSTAQNCGRSDDPNSPDGIVYLGGTEPW